jgi:hypothetical protein
MKRNMLLYIAVKQIVKSNLFHNELKQNTDRGNKLFFQKRRNL